MYQGRRLLLGRSAQLVKNTEGRKVLIGLLELTISELAAGELFRPLVDAEWLPGMVVRRQSPEAVARRVASRRAGRVKRAAELAARIAARAA